MRLTSTSAHVSQGTSFRQHTRLSRPQLHVNTPGGSLGCTLASAPWVSCYRQVTARSMRPVGGGGLPLQCQDATPRCLAKCAAGPEVVGGDAKSAIGLRTVRVHYMRRDRRHMGYGLHIWGYASHPTQWMEPLKPTGFNDEGSWWDVVVKEGSGRLGMLVYKGEQKSAEAELDLDDSVSELWLVGDEKTVFTECPDLDALPTGSITKQASLWTSKDVIVWRHGLNDASGNAHVFKLHYSASASLRITGKGVEGADDVFTLSPTSGGTPRDVVRRFPHLYGCLGLQLPEEAVQQAPKLLKGQLLMSMVTADGVPVDATGVQIQGVLDDLYSYEGPLGYHDDRSARGGTTISVWAPTATSVQLLHWEGPTGGQAEEFEMSEGDMGPGVWSFKIPSDGPSWMWTYYKFRVTVYCPWTRQNEVSEVTDPYSRSLAADGERTQIVDMDHASTQPNGWVEHRGPPIAKWTDISLYELHVRDFSISDESVPSQLRGKYLAFSPEHTGGPTHGQKHMAKLQEAGLNHVHLLPLYDFGSVPERESDQMTLKSSLAGLPPDSKEQQEAVLAIADQDGFNWGYDPVHWGVPDGSYATDPDGLPRIVEFRTMVKSLHEQGWRVVLDVVYNHIFSAGPHDRNSVYDKVVPGYYLRRLEDGEICNSTCCNNTATEHFMCERLAVEDIIHWAKTYKVDSFRFDIMGHLMVSTLQKMRRGLDALTVEKDGVDGKSIYIYGEAWDFGEVAANQRGRNCGQMNLAGTRLGAFNDRLRDGALGGGPFAPFYHQGLVTGLALSPNSYPQGDPMEQLDHLLYLTDMVRYSLAGNLRKYSLLCKDGAVRTGDASQMHGLPLAYGAHPEENVAFIGCHDNQTLFDQVTEKTALTVMAVDRARICALSLSLIALSQGVPFFHAGDELLRSKSLDRDSYNSGDHFNRIDWTGQDNNFGVGLPPATKNRSGWSYKGPLLANPLIKPTPSHIKATEELFLLFLRIRYSSPLFRLPSADDIFRQLHFHDIGPEQTPGIIIMELTSADVAAANPPMGPVRADAGEGTVDPNFKRIVVVFNCSPLEQRVDYPHHVTHLELHPLVASFSGVEAVRLKTGCIPHNPLKQLTLAARTTGVFVEPK